MKAAVSATDENSTKGPNLVLLKALPIEMRRQLGGPKKIREMTGDMLVAHMNQEMFQQIWGVVKRNKQWKKANGYCQGQPSCISRLPPGAPDSMCAACRTAQQNYYRNGGTRAKRMTDYGRWRVVQRTMQRAERDAR